MRQTWRWFGKHDVVNLQDICQAGATGVVSALHHIPSGKVWPASEIEKRQQEIAYNPQGNPTNLNWDVVESLPVSEAIKTKNTEFKAHILAYQQSLKNLATAGIQVVCYNFMPVLDWTRTQLHWPLPNGATTMMFDEVDFAVFDIHLLQRKAALEETPIGLQQQAGERQAKMSKQQNQQLVSNIVAGLPGANEGWTLEQLQQQLKHYAQISTQQFKQNLVDFLTEVIPVAENLGIRLACHPDDPPFSLLGLPRIVSTEADYQHLVQVVKSPANGITFCTGSLGVRADIDLTGMVNRLGQHIHFVHLRNTTRISTHTFYEAAHLAGDTDMVSVIQALLQEQKQRRLNGRKDWQIPMRPDHGQQMLTDLQQKTQAGYPAIGRLKGLAEIRGVMQALNHSLA